MKKNITFRNFSFLLIFLIFIRICTVAEPIKYSMNIYPEEKTQTLTTQDENARVLVLFNRKVIDLESPMEMVPDFYLDKLFDFLTLILSLLFVNVVFDLRRKISKYMIYHLNSSKYKASAFFL